MPGDKALQHKGVALADGVDALTDVVLFHHTRLACVDDLGLRWGYKEWGGLDERHQG